LPARSSHAHFRVNKRSEALRKHIWILIAAAALSACATAPTKPDSTGGAWLVVGDASAQRHTSSAVSSSPPKQVFWFLAGR
jgi:uncharacterized lipoprotein YajG